MTIEKYGYEVDEEKTKTGEHKELTEKDAPHCPICGSLLMGRPPTCWKHGSEPFEKRKRDGQE